MTIKPAYLVTDMDRTPTHDETGEFCDYPTEKKALAAAKDRLAYSEGQDAEVWVWRLSHVLSKPQVDPVIDRVE